MIHLLFVVLAVAGWGVAATCQTSNGPARDRAGSVAYVATVLSLMAAFGHATGAY